MADTDKPPSYSETTGQPPYPTTAPYPTGPSPPAAPYGGQPYGQPYPQYPAGTPNQPTTVVVQPVRTQTVIVPAGAMCPRCQVMIKYYLDSMLRQYSLPAVLTK